MKKRKEKKKEKKERKKKIAAKGIRTSVSIAIVFQSDTLPAELSHPLLNSVAKFSFV